MANREFSLPIKGVFYGLPVDKSPQATSGYMNNVFPRDTLEQKIRLGQRPGLEKMFTDQIGGDAAAIVAVIEVTKVD